MKLITDSSTQMNNIVANSLVVLAQVSSSVAPGPSIEWLSNCVMNGLVCTTGSGGFCEDSDQADARLAQNAQSEGPAIPYGEVRRELGLE